MDNDGTMTVSVFVGASVDGFATVGHERDLVAGAFKKKTRDFAIGGIVLGEKNAGRPRRWNRGTHALRWGGDGRTGLFGRSPRR